MVHRGIATAAAIMSAVVLGSQAEAGGPNRNFSDVDPNIVVCPAGDSLFRIIARSFPGVPSASSVAVIDFCGCPGIVVAPAQPTDGYSQDGCRILTVSNQFGIIDLYLRAGGVCSGAVTILCDGKPFGTFAHVASTDQNGDQVVTQADVDVAASKLGGADLTADLDGDLAVTANDVAIVQAHLGHSFNGTVDVPPSAPGSLRMYCAPNPARGDALIAFDLPQQGPVRIEAFDSNGRRVRELANGREFPAGTHRVTWNGRDDAGARLSPGIYFIRIEAAGQRRFARIARVQ